ncbi:DDE-type integrase/transposase/recombinase [Sphingomonas sp. SUN019]|uniref:DDE-type integrase/transposase/recombinase n=1 Tax=Sphingomonas sp. SUN019 TaxID=2937788 RepID=UPI0021644913|nr:DDE-type integrase/transposase/recombinase [Sphingomonas sp. SUN019]UVO50216.1 DDE-type integrase/transposase/recombinase [Sphingomonas sp. SUN019]
MLESFVSKTRDKAAALAFIKKALKRHGSPEKITTDGLRSYGAAMDELVAARNRRSAAGPTTGWKIATCRFDDESAR